MITPLKQTDYAVAKRIFQETFVESEDSYFASAWKNRNEDATLGYWHKGTLMGAGIVSNNKLEYIFTHELCRGNGVGTRLLYAILKVCPNLHLVPVDDPAIRAWYIKHGFRLSSHRGDRQVYVRHTHDLRQAVVVSNLSMLIR
jgi:GNAT superfamily N-acetyltransferase